MSSDQPHAPLSEERPSEHERRVQQSSSVEPIQLRWLDYADLVAEVRRLRSDVVGMQAIIDLHDSRAHCVAREQENARLRELLREWAGHKYPCLSFLEEDSDICDCGRNDMLERELAGEGKEGL